MFKLILEIKTRKRERFPYLISFCYHAIDSVFRQSEQRIGCAVECMDLGDGAEGAAEERGQKLHQISRTHLAKPKAPSLFTQY